MNISPEMKALILCSHSIPTPVDIKTIKRLIRKKFNWEFFISLMKEHRFCGPVYKTFNDTLKEVLPVNVHQQIKGHHLNNIKKSLKKISASISISSAFKENDIDHLFLKGLCLSNRLYNNPGFRYSGDIDLIVPEKKIDVAGRILESHGYRQVQSEETLSKCKMELFKKTHHHLKYKSNKTKTEIELHWRFSPVKEAFPISFEEAWSKKHYSRINGYDLPVPVENHTLLHLFFHGSKHTWSRLFWLKDIVDFLSNTNEFDTTLFFQDAKKYNLLRPVSEGFYLSNLYYGIEIPDQIRSYSQKEWQLKGAIKSITYLHQAQSGPLPILISHLHGLFLLKSNKYKYSYIKKIVLAKKYKHLFNPNHKSALLKSLRKK